MDLSFVSMTTLKKYLKYVLITIVIIIAVVYFLNHSFYTFSVSGVSKFDVKTVDNQGSEAGVFKLFGVYAIPRNAEIFSVQSQVNKSPFRENTYRMNESRRSLGMHHLSVTLHSQRDTASNGANYGCVFGSYPNVYGYNCASPDNIYRLHDDVPDSTPIVNTLPLTTIKDSIRTTPSTSNTLLFGWQKYENGLLTIIADRKPETSLYTNTRLMFIDGNSQMTEYPLNIPGADQDISRYSLSTNTSGKNGYIIIDNSSNKAYMFDNLGVSPASVNLSSTYKNAPQSCTLNDSKVVCFAGIHDTLHDAEDEGIVGDGVMTIYSRSLKEEEYFRIPKDNALNTICIDKNNSIYSATGSSIYRIYHKGTESSFRPISLQAKNFACGNLMMFIENNRIYTPNSDDSATLVYGDSYQNAKSIDGIGDNYSFASSYPSHDASVVSVSLLTRPIGDNEQRISDLVSRVVERSKPNYFTTRYSKDSVSYSSFLTHADSEKLKKNLLDFSRDQGIPFTPEFIDYSTLRQKD